MRVHRSIAVLACCAAAGVALAQPSNLPAGFANCETLQTCIHALDLIAPSRESGAGSPSLDRQLAIRLEAFGEPAKREVLKRAAGTDKGWRRLAGWLLMYWQSFNDSDVPALIAALQAEPGGGAARALGRIGTTAAVDALAEDVRLHGAENQSGWALSQLGERVFPYLLPLLSDDKGWHEAAAIMRDMKSKAADGLDAWLAIALDAARSEQDRVGALRGIGILGTSAKQVAPKIRPLLAVSDGYGTIPETARKVLAAMGDESVASDAALACEPSTDPFEGSLESTICLQRAAAYGDAIMPYANLVLTTFTTSRTGADRAGGASLLGFIGYRPAGARMIELLRDPDWRVVYAAVRSLGWLHSTSAIAALTDVARNYWLADVRNQATKVIADLQLPASALPRPAPDAGTLEHPPQVPLEIDATYAPDIAPCQSGRWEWHGREFREPDSVHMKLSVEAHGELPAGLLAGRDNGEWGGDVKWEPISGEPLLVIYANVEGMEPADDGAVAVIGSGGVWTSYDANRRDSSDWSSERFTVGNGPGGSGYAVALRRDDGGAWRVEQVARFPRAAFGLKTIGHDLFVAWSGNRAIVFTSTGIAGVAQCIAAK